MASIHSAPAESQVDAPTKLAPALSKVELKVIQEPAKNADSQIKTGQTWIWAFTVNEIALIALQIVATVIAAIFGAWAIRSYDSAQIANELSKKSLSESETANMLAKAALDQTYKANKIAIWALCQAESVSISRIKCILDETDPIFQFNQA